MDINTNNSIDAAVTSLASKSMGGGAVTSVFGWLTANENVALVGLAVTVLGFLLNLIFQVRRDRREQELQRAKILALHQPPLGQSEKPD